MTNWLDFKELRNRLDFAKVLQHYGVETKITAGQHHGFCPLPRHQGKRNSPSFSANIKRGIWQCFGCGGKGNLLDFAVLMEGGNPRHGADVRRVASQLEKELLSDAEKPKTQPDKSNESEDENIIINAPLDFELKGLDAMHPSLVVHRELNFVTIDYFGLGYCSRGLLKNRIAIPLHDPQGRLVGYAGRVVDDDKISEDNPKYKFPGRRKRKGVIHEFRKSLLLYNAHRIEANVDNLAVVEGFASVWWLRQAHFFNSAALMGASCSLEQAEMIVSLVSPQGHVWIMTDGDSAGERCAAEVFSRVAAHRAVRWAKLEIGKQPTDLSVESLKQLLPFGEKS